MRENRSSGFPTRCDTNRPVQSLKQDRCLKLWIYVEEELYYPCSKNIGAELICAFVFASAKIWFSHDAAHVMFRFSYG